jgi:hypothetical protein
MTNDSILDTFLAILCSQCNLSYLSAFFVTVLQRDKTWDAVSDWFNVQEPSTYSRPNLSSTTPILSPCHVHGSHWVAVVHRIINNSVHFYYADDLNHEETERSIKQLLGSYNRRFFPIDATWTKCESITYRPHSNECGPRTLMALTIMAIHPNPSSGILLPYMDSNLAQITRTWIASALLTGQVAIPSQHLQPATDLSSSRSIPCYLIPWSTVSPTNLSHSNPPHDANSSNKSKVRQDRNNRQRKISPVSTARTPP